MKWLWKCSAGFHIQSKICNSTFIEYVITRSFDHEIMNISEALFYANIRNELKPEVILQKCEVTTKPRTLHRADARLWLTALWLHKAHRLLSTPNRRRRTNNTRKPTMNRKACSIAVHNELNGLILKTGRSNQIAIMLAIIIAVAKDDGVIAKVGERLHFNRSFSLRGLGKIALRDVILWVHSESNEIKTI